MARKKLRKNTNTGRRWADILKVDTLLTDLEPEARAHISNTTEAFQRFKPQDTRKSGRWKDEENRVYYFQGIGRSRIGGPEGFTEEKSTPRSQVTSGF